MSGSGFSAVKVSEHVWWVGAIDWALRDFHGYSTQRGSTYNAYLVMGDYPILVDTVKAQFRDEMLARVASVVNPADVKVVVSHHAEMDHSGSLPQVIDIIKPDKVYASQMGVKNLHDQFHGLGEVTAVKDSETLKLAGLTFTFLETRMLHWPDSMISYLHEDELVFSQDGFGMHLATPRLFADENDPAVMLYEGKKYYANILLPYSPLVLKLLDRIRLLGISIRTIAPDHGPVWRKDLGTLLGWYARWAEQKPENRAVLAHDSMWQSTAMMARSMADGLREGGTDVAVIPMSCMSRSDVMTELLCAGAFLVGSPTLNNGMFPTVADVLTYAKGLKPRNLIGAAFGSHGWSGEACAQIETALREMGVEIALPAMRLKFVPDAAALDQCREFGRAVAAKLQERVGM
ncbi:FprA family A-type flavoprotein [candidate division WOR-3 bacterium]|uniref:FprA family A-type flavoprotein n=1 Tax=candidate division WOR-3 bacterium TaxID=2052148 RepID=A0A937XE36_UNCW3|nr:FprA family A-type flavoprotein [candidate division WOR-3 bacterium]